MTTISTYDLQQIINKRFVPSFESEQEIEIETNEVIINQFQTTDGEIEELAEESTVVAETSDSLDDIDNTTEALESLIYSMESSILTGGFDLRNAQIANVALESIAAQYKLDSNYLTFGLEEVGEDGEAETKSTIDKAKSMIGALKDSAGALLNKMYGSVLAALGSATALSEKLIAKAMQLKNNVDASNKGGNAVKLNKGVKRKLTVDGTTVLAPDKYLAELKRLTSKYNSVVKVYADTNVLSAFSEDVVKGMSGTTKQTVANKAIIASVRALSSDINKKISSNDNSVEMVSDPYLGGARIHMAKPTVAAVQKALTVDAPKDSVSQEGIAALYKNSWKVTLGAVLTVLGITGFALNTYLATMATKVLFNGAALKSVAALTGGTVASAAGGMIVLTLVSIAFAVLWYHGVKKGINMIVDGWKGYTDEIKKAVDAFKGLFKKTTEEAAEVATEFELETSGVSMEADEASVSVNSLSGNQIKTLTDIIINTSGTTKTMKAQLAKRQAVSKNIDTITKELAKADGSNVEATKAASAFIRRYIKQTIKFEMQLTNYTVGVMKAALAYAEASNATVVSTESVDLEEKKTVA